MRDRVWVLGLIGVLLLGTAAWCEDVASTLRVRIPQGLDPTKAIVLVGQFGEGLAIGLAARVGETSEFTERIAGATTSIKVVVHYPGCKLAVKEMEWADISDGFAPNMEKLAPVPLTIKLTTSDGAPIANHKISLTQPMLNMVFSDRMGGGIAGKGYTPVAASGTTDASGLVTLQVPRLTDDPAFETYKQKPEFGVRIDEPAPSPTGFNLVPPSIPARENYDQPQVVKMIHRGKLSGQVGAAFLAKHGITAPLGGIVGPNGASTYKVWFHAQESTGRGGQGVAVKEDGTFSMDLPPGTYDLAVEVTDRTSAPEKTISIEKGSVLGENEDRKIVLE